MVLASDHCVFSEVCHCVCRAKCTAPPARAIAVENLILQLVEPNLGSNEVKLRKQQKAVWDKKSAGVIKQWQKDLTPAARASAHPADAIGSHAAGTCAVFPPLTSCICKLFFPAPTCWTLFEMLWPINWWPASLWYLHEIQGNLSKFDSWILSPGFLVGVDLATKAASQSYSTPARTAEAMVCPRTTRSSCLVTGY